MGSRLSWSSLLDHEREVFSYQLSVISQKLIDSLMIKSLTIEKFSPFFNDSMTR
jgi:hypothetical protein